MTDKEIIKALEISSVALMYGEEVSLYKLALDLINRQQAEIERLQKEVSIVRRKALLEAARKFAGHSDYHGDTILGKLICMAEGKEVGEARPLELNEIKAEAIKEVLGDIHTEIYKALLNNTDVKNRRLDKALAKNEPLEYDTFLPYVEGKIDALRGIGDFVCDYVKEMVGEQG